MLNFLYPPTEAELAKEKKQNKSKPAAAVANEDLSIVESPNDDTAWQEKHAVTFDGNFETGNLQAAFEVKKNVYDVWLRCDNSSR